MNTPEATAAADLVCELQEAYGLIEELMGSLYADAPFGDHGALAQYAFDALDAADDKHCPNCGERLDAGQPFLIGPGGGTWCPGCAHHIGCGCPSDPLGRPTDDEHCHQPPLTR